MPGQPSELPALKQAKPLYEFGLSFELGTGNYSRSKVCSIMPRYTVCNRLGYTLQLVQAGLEEEANAVVELSDNEVQAFHWIDASRQKQCRARVVPSIGTHETFSTAWSGLIDPEQVGNFCIRFPPDGQGGSPLNVFIEIRQRRAATFIVLRQEKPDKSQYAVINRSGRDIETWQLKASNAGAAAEPTRYKIAAGERHPVAWDRPMQGRVLAVQLPGVREPVQVKMEEFGEVKLPGELHGEVFADGYTRALRISDKATARSAVSSTRSGGTD
jgi:hypothetical protein